MRPRAKRLGLLLLLGALTTAQSPRPQLWASWDLDLAGHAPPTHFVLTVSSPSGVAVPPAMQVPWARCTQVPQAQHCAPIGCPPTGRYEFWVQAQYSAGRSDRSNVAACEVTSPQQCTCMTAGMQPPAPTPATPVRPSPATPTPTTEPPPLPQRGPEGLGLVPVGTPLPQVAQIPPLPQSGSS